ncbi:HMA2 domain-containing protein [Clostridium formicaceticum]|nr:hypothetical protein [Clostridium formicaceticum]
MKLPNKKIKIISSIPGRIRLKIEGASKYEKLGYKVVCLFQDLRGIENISFNNTTGNILVLYNNKYLNEGEIIKQIEGFDFSKCLDIFSWPREESIIRIIFKSLNPFCLGRKKYPNKIYKNEYVLSKTLIKLGFLLGTALFLFTSYSMNILSIGILAYPGILFAIASVAYYYAAESFKYHSIFIKKSENIGLLGKTTDVFIQDQILLQEEKVNNIAKEKDLSRMYLQKLITLGKVKNPISSEGQTIIQELRKYGILNITLCTGKKDALTEYIAYYFGLDHIDQLNDQESYITKEQHQKVKLLICHQDFIAYRKKISGDVMMNIETKSSKKVIQGDINLLQKDIIKLPQILRFSGNTDELITRTQVRAVTINVIALFLTMIRQIHPFTAIGIYGINMLAQLIILQNNIHQGKGVLYNAYK